MAWNPDQYLKFAQPRFRPALDLLARVDADAPRTVVDLGCGTGNVTQVLAARWGQAKIIGVDDSAEMLAQARSAHAGIDWRQEGIAVWQPDDSVDVLYSNAALHWLPDHAALFPRLMGYVAPGGYLAVQMPRNFAAPSHASIADTVRSGPWRARLESLLRPSPVSEPSFYYELLAPYAAQIDIWETEYLQVLSGKNPVKEWTRGTWLPQFLDALDGPEERQAFEEDYAKRVELAYPPLANGDTPFPFRRLFMVVQKKA